MVNAVKAHVAAIEYALPEKMVTNDDLDAAHPEWSIHKLAARTGVFTRYICAEDETGLDLAATACEKLFSSGVVSKSDIGGLIVCTQTPDHIMPPNSAILQHRLGLPISVTALDFTLACSGFIYGLMMTKAMIESGALDNILLVTTETYSKHIHPDDRATMALFGDGAAVTLVRRGAKGVGEVVLGTDGSGWDRFTVAAGGARMPKSELTCIPVTDQFGNVRTPENIYMDGRAVLNFVKKRIPSCVDSVMDKSGLTSKDISMFIFHQGSALSLDLVEKTLEIPKHKTYRNVDRVGNTVSSSIPIAIKYAQNEEVLLPDSRLLLCGFGVGFSWGACILDL